MGMETKTVSVVVGRRTFAVSLSIESVPTAQRFSDAPPPCELRTIEHIERDEVTAEADEE
jgi:hypothetical protein